jgi:hypothetical protein
MMACSSNRHYTCGLTLAHADGLYLSVTSTRNGLLINEIVGWIQYVHPDGFSACVNSSPGPCAWF